MRTCTTIFFIGALTVLMAAGCTSSSNPGNSTNTNGFNGVVGANFFPLASDKILHGHITATQTSYDSNGTVLQTEFVDRDCQASIGALTSFSGYNVYPIYAWGFDGSPKNHGNPLYYLGVSDTSQLFGLAQAHSVTTMLPSDVSTGNSWVDFPNSLLSGQSGKLTVVAQLPSYTTKLGKTYQNVLQINGTELTLHRHPTIMVTADITILAKLAEAEPSILRKV